MRARESIIGPAIFAELQFDLAEFNPIIRYVLIDPDQRRERELGPDWVSAGCSGLIVRVGPFDLPRAVTTAIHEEGSCNRQPNKRQFEKEGSVLHDLYILLIIRDL
jgi:hypothetical protein